MTPVLRCVLVGLLVLLGCSPAREAEPTTGLSAPRRSPGASPAAGPPTLDARRLAKVPGGTFGPYVVEMAAAPSLIWAEPTAGGRAWYSLDSNDPKPQKLVSSTGELRLAAVRSAPGGERAIVVSALHDGATHRIEAFVVDDRSRSRPSVATVAEGREEILWIEAMPLSRGALVLWAVRRGESATLLARTLGAGESEPRTLVQGALAWQGVAHGGGAAVAAVMDSAGGPMGPVKLFRVDESGSLIGGPLTVNAAASAAQDVDLIALTDGLLLGWTDNTGGESRVHVARVDGAGKVAQAPSAVVPSLGEQAFLKLAKDPSGAGAYLIFEPVGRAPQGQRTIAVARLDQLGRFTGDRAHIDHFATDGTLPEVAPFAGGVGVLTRAPVCEQGAECASTRARPFYVRLDRSLSVVGGAPIPANDGWAALAWGLSCRGDACAVLAASAQDPAPIFTVDVTAVSDGWRLPANSAPRPEPPRLAGVRALASIDLLADIDVLSENGATLAATLTYFDPSTPYERLSRPAPDGRFDPLRALLQIWLPDEPDAAPQTISLRARSLGGVALAPMGGSSPGALLAWAALDNGQPQVFLTLLDGRGKKVSQRMLTRSDGEVSDVAAARVADGWIVAWVDERDGDPEIYAAKIDARLQRVGPEQRVTRAPGAASGPALLPVADGVVLVWADAREGEKPGWSDIYTTKLAASDAAPAAERVLFASRHHAHSPVLAARGDGVVVAWGESEIDAGLQSRGHGLRLLELGAGNGPIEIDVEGAPASLSMECGATTCRIVAATTGARAALWAIEAGARGAPLVRQLGAVSGPGGQALLPALGGGGVVFTERARDGRARLKQLRIEWSPGSP